MPIKVTCENCGVTLKTADSAAGKKAKCPKCQGPIVVPLLAATSEPVLDAEPTPANDDWDDFDQESELAANKADAGSDREPCPACGEMIVSGAAKCRFCGEYFDANLAKAEKKKATSGEDGRLTVAEWIIAIICSGIGCIAGIVWIIQGKPKGKKMLMVSLVAQGFWVAVRLLAEAANQGVQ